MNPNLGVQTQSKGIHDSKTIITYPDKLRVVLQSGYIICLIFGEKWNVL